MTTSSNSSSSQLQPGRPKRRLFQPRVCVVDFHHARGPEVEFWVSKEGRRLYAKNDWSLLPFMALSDGSHARTEEYSWFTLLDRADGDGRADDRSGEQDKVTATAKARARPGDTTLFGIACTRQIRSDSLKNKSADVTRSSVQKSVVVVVGDARGLGELKTRLGFVTESWFSQRDFSDIEILKAFQDSLIKVDGDDDGRSGESYFGLSLREVIYDFRHQTLVLIKALILQRKILFFGSSCEQVCLLQFALINLIPGLMAHLEDCAHPDLDAAETAAEKSLAESCIPAALPNGSSRAELLSFVGQPLRIFGKGSVFMPYAPLQHLDLLADYDTKSYVVGSTNSLLLQQKEHYADLLVNMDDQQNSISILSPSLRQALQLSAADRRWIDALTEKVVETWDERNPSQPKGMGYQGSEDAIRLAFEDYILSLCSCMAYQKYREEVDGQEKKSSFDKISRAVKARRSAEIEVVRAEFDESALPRGGEEEEEEEEGKDKGKPKEKEEQDKRPKTPPPRPSRDEESSTRRSRSRSSIANANKLLNAIISSPPKKIDLVAQTYDPADNTADFSAHFLSAWQETVNCQRFLRQVEGKRIFDVVEPRHPTAGGFNIDDLNRRLAQNLGELRKQYNVDERYALARGRAGEALQASRERWGRWWNDLEERRRQRSSGGRNDDDDNNNTNVDDTSGGTTDESVGAGSGAGGWGAATKERSSRPAAAPAAPAAATVPVVDTEAMQRAARESAAKAGAYLSSWGAWAQQKRNEWQQQHQHQQQNKEQEAK